MSVRRGLFRAWAMFTVIWVLAVGGSALNAWYHDPWRVISEVRVAPSAPRSDVASSAGRPVPKSDLPDALRAPPVEDGP
jgi:hypothetical protein